MLIETQSQLAYCCAYIISYVLVSSEEQSLHYRNFFFFFFKCNTAIAVKLRAQVNLCFSIPGSEMAELGYFGAGNI